MKPLGIRLGIGGTMRVVHPSRVEDAVWNAVEEALCAGWTAQRLKAEFADAWGEALRRQAKDDAKVLES